LAQKPLNETGREAGWIRQPLGAETERRVSVTEISAEHKVMKKEKAFGGQAAHSPTVKSSGPMLQIATTARQYCLKGVLGLVPAIFLAFSAQAANWYVRSSSAGANNGTDWNNAWTASTINWNNVQPGDTIWLAGGAYGTGMRVGKSGAAGNSISIKRVLASDSTAASAAGWSASFDSLVILNSISVVGSSYITVDGRVTYGIQIKIGAGGGTGIIVNDSSGPTHPSNDNFYNIEVLGPYTSTASQNVDGLDAYINNCSWVNSMVSNCWMHGLGCGFKSQNWTNIIIDHCFLADFAPDGAQHVDVAYNYTDDLTIWRYNIISNCPNDGLFFEYGGAHNLYFYGNVYLASYGTLLAFKPDGNAYGPVYVYNNVFYNANPNASVTPSVGFDSTIGSASSITLYNNVFWGVVNKNANSVNSGVSGYNAYNNWNYGGYSIPNDPNSVFSITNCFVNPAAGNFHLLPGSVLRNAGKSLTTDGAINKDPDGVQRGGNGGWAIGAYEFSTGITTNPVIMVSPNSLDFGTLFTNTATNLTFTVINVGGGTLAGSVSVPAPFQVVSGGTYSLGSNQPQTVTIQFNPTAAGPASQTVTFSGGGGATATVTGTGYAKQPGLSFNSTAGTITFPFTVTGNYISQNVDVSQSGAAGVASGGSAVYGFSIPTAGPYTITASVNASNSSSKSFWINIDTQPTDPTMIWDVFPYTSGFENRLVSWRGTGGPTNDQFAPKVFNLSVGNHYLVVRGRETGVQLGALTISAYSTNSTPPSSPTVSAIASSSADVDPTRAGMQVFAGSVVQYSATASDPNGLPLTWQWLYSFDGSADTVYQSGTGAVTPISVNYPASVANNTYVWKLRVSNGTATAESDLSVDVETPPATQGNLTFSATSGTVSGQFATTNGSIYQTVETSTTNGGRATYNFTLTNAGSYVVQILLNAPNTAANSLYLNIDADPQDPTMIFDVPLTSGFEQRIASWRGNGTFDNNQFVPKVFTLSAGAHQLVVLGREAGLQLQNFAILKLPPPPQNFRVLTAGP
jgi:hypothetical protein